MLPIHPISYNLNVGDLLFILVDCNLWLSKASAVIIDVGNSETCLITHLIHAECDMIDKNTIATISGLKKI